MDEPKKPPEWKKVTEPKINQQMKTLLREAVKLASTEVAELRRKLDRLTYGG